jgi:hypothetical protein
MRFRKLRISWLSRVIAIALAFGGMFFGVFLFMIGGLKPLLYPPTAAGYLVTIGYIVRAASTPPLWMRRAIWIASIVVQGAWFCWNIPDVLREANPADGILIFSWWGFAVAASMVALVNEPDKNSFPTT